MLPETAGAVVLRYGLRSRQQQDSCSPGRSELAEDRSAAGSRPGMPRALNTSFAALIGFELVGSEVGFARMRKTPIVR